MSEKKKQPHAAAALNAARQRLSTGWPMPLFLQGAFEFMQAALFSAFLVVIPWFAVWFSGGFADRSIESVLKMGGQIWLLIHAVPLHLLTGEAFEVYLRALKPGGILLVHISNRFIALEPALGAAARANGLSAIVRRDIQRKPPLTSSLWVAMARDPARLAELQSIGGAEWRAIDTSRNQQWTDDYASILPDINWSRFL